MKSLEAALPPVLSQDIEAGARVQMTEWILAGMVSCFPAMGKLIATGAFFTSLMPGVEYHPSPNQDGRPVDAVVDTVIVHATVIDTLAETIGRLTDTDKKVSAHYVIDRDGRIIQLVGNTSRAWHAGVSELHGRPKVNGFSIGIEIINRNDGIDKFTDAQYRSVAKIINYARSTYSIPNANIVSHASVALPPGRKTDPVGFDFERLFKFLDHQ